MRLRGRLAWRLSWPKRWGGRRHVVLLLREAGMGKSMR